MAGTENPSDMATKHVEYSAPEHQLHLMNCKFLQGRPELAPQVVNYACEDDVNAMSDWGGETVTCGSNLVGEKGALSGCAKIMSMRRIVLRQGRARDARAAFFLSVPGVRVFRLLDFLMPDVRILTLGRS